MSHQKVQERRNYIQNLVKEYNADGVMYEQIKFCEYWGYERALASYVMTNDYGIPTAAVDRQYTASASGQLRTRVQAFVESLEIKKIAKEREAKKNG
jgi:benzoyl-CoA reductase/2-hydroxyglutaryl-CoA dehydratase subunit BcrC/BadD/HgdB